MPARIFRVEPSVTQSGRRHGECWRLSFVPDRPKTVDPVMGWTGSTDTRPEIVLDFSSREAAESFARRNRYAFETVPETVPQPAVQCYGANFYTDRKIPWSH